MDANPDIIECEPRFIDQREKEQAAGYPAPDLHLYPPDPVRYCDTSAQTTRRHLSRKQKPWELAWQRAEGHSGGSTTTEGIGKVAPEAEMKNRDPTKQSAKKPDEVKAGRCKKQDLEPAVVHKPEQGSPGGKRGRPDQRNLPRKKPDTSGAKTPKSPDPEQPPLEKPQEGSLEVKRGRRDQLNLPRKKPDADGAEALKSPDPEQPPPEASGV
ncbi:hypothetical protein MTO96_009346 [Rhipicephalus appendiculatus]